jgi:hypothetical protein
MDIDIMYSTCYSSPFINIRNTSQPQEHGTHPYV